jgi:asparagine synthase (glutamine-hydrolysing)
MRGQFALACWDGRRKRLLLARDHLGQRSLFYQVEPDLLVFCSELAPLLRAASRCELDPEGAYWYLAFGMPPPGRTLARGIERVPAAHVLCWEPRKPPLLQRYWTPLDADAPREATPDVIEALQKALDRAIAQRIQGDALPGLFLSGGVDSTYIAATTTLIAKDRPRAFTSAFEAQHGMNETEYAQAVAEWLGLEHHVIPLYAESALELLDDVVLSAAEPCGAWATLTHFRILATARQLGVTRMVSGLGADEIFGGYDHFRGYYARFLRYRQQRPAPPGGEAFEALMLPEDQTARRTLYPGVARFFDDASLRQATHSSLHGWQYASHLRSFYRECRRLKPEAEAMEMMVAHECQHRIPDLLFANFEPLSRRMAVEVSYPFLDPDLVRLCAGLSAESRYRTPSGRFSLRLRDLHPRFKHAMLEVARGRVPDAIRDRPRKSFTAPFGGWLSQPHFCGPVLSQLRRSRFWDQGLVRREWLDHVLERVVPGPNPWVFQFWALLTLTAWYDRFVEPPKAP